MKEIIRKRKAIRKYDLAPLDAVSLEKVWAQIEAVKPLYPAIHYSIEIVNGVTGIFNVKAPHYLIFRSEKQDGAYENIGYMGQQMDLFFSGSEIGSCWLGMAKPKDTEKPTLLHVISMAFGKPDEPVYRKLSEFQRRPLSEISEGTDERLEAARLAPSAMNAQNWYFVAVDGKIHCYRKQSKGLFRSVYDKLHAIDMGIALCHIAAESTEFSFSKEADIPERKGYVYMGTVEGEA